MEGEDRRGLPPTSVGIEAPSWVKRHPLAFFFALAFLLTWAVEIPVRLYPAENGAFQVIVGWLPGLAALVAAGLTSGLPAQRALLRRMFIARVGRRWYLVALFGILPIWLGAQALDRLAGGAGVPGWDAVFDLVGPFLINWLLHLFLSTEELAWRGFALPRLQARQPALVASLVIGVISALWYLPVFVIAPTAATPAVVPFMIATIALSVFYAWIFNNTRGSVLLCGLANAAANTWTDILPPPAADQILAQWIYAVLLVAVVAIIALAFGPERLSRRPAAEFPVESPAS